MATNAPREYPPTRIHVHRARVGVVHEDETRGLDLNALGALILVRIEAYQVPDEAFTLDAEYLADKYDQDYRLVLEGLEVLADAGLVGRAGS